MVVQSGAGMTVVGRCGDDDDGNCNDGGEFGTTRVGYCVLRLQREGMGYGKHKREEGKRGENAGEDRGERVRELGGGVDGRNIDGTKL